MPDKDHSEVVIILDAKESNFELSYNGILINDVVELTFIGDKEMTESGKPGIHITFRTEKGHLIVAQTTWRLFSSVYRAFAERYGEDFDAAGMRVVTDEHHIEFVQSDKPFVQCGHCKWQLDGENTRESIDHLLREMERHYKKRHPKLKMPPRPDFPGLN